LTILVEGCWAGQETTNFNLRQLSRDKTNQHLQTELQNRLQDLEHRNNELNNKETQLIEMKKALDDLDKQGIDSLILDLRNNPGGLLDIAIKVANFFLKKDEDCNRSGYRP